jgi:hypothetical protein
MSVISLFPVHRNLLIMEALNYNLLNGNTWMIVIGTA